MLSDKLRWQWNIIPRYALTAESTARFWTEPVPVDRFVLTGMRKHFLCHNNLSGVIFQLQPCFTFALCCIVYLQCKQCNNQWPTLQSTPHRCLSSVKFLMADALAGHKNIANIGVKANQISKNDKLKFSHLVRTKEVDYWFSKHIRKKIKSVRILCIPTAQFCNPDIVEAKGMFGHSSDHNCVFSF